MLILPDIHCPYEDKKAVKVALKIARDLKPDILTYIGDCIDAEGISKYTVKTAGRGVGEVIREIKYFRENIYDPFKKACKPERILWCGGNHDYQRIYDLIAKMRAKGEEDMADMFKEKLDLQKNFPDAEIVPWNESHKIGHLYLTHGTYHNDAHAKKHVTAYEDNVVYGHLHSIQTYTKVTKGSKQAHKATCLGCLCNTNPEYLKNKPNSWIHAVGIAYFFPNGNFNLYTIEIINGRCIWNGKIYS